MAGTALRIQHRWLFMMALLAGVSYFLADQGGMPAAAVTAWKGSAVAMLALWAALNARTADGWILAAVLALGAAGDVLLESSVTAGALAFLAGHVVATILYLRHRRTARTSSQTVLAVLLLVATPLVAFLLPADRATAPGVALYALVLGAMAGSAWASRFPRYRVGIGAILFVASDLLLFARMGRLAASPLPHLLVWPLYLAGQTLIAWGGVTALLGWKNDDDLHHRL